MGVSMKSIYGDRDTVGTVYIEAQKSDVKGLLNGDINSQMVPHLIKDINKALQLNPFDGRPFYVNVTEKRDAQMKNAFRRKIIKTLYRPFPEFSTYVLHMTPKTQRVCYCWDLPHHTEMINVLSQPFQYDEKYVESIVEWKNNDLVNFGFLKVSMNSSQVEGYEEGLINTYRKHYENFCKYIGMEGEDLANEKSYGFFWVPNKYFKDLVVNSPNPMVSVALPA